MDVFFNQGRYAGGWWGLCKIDRTCYNSCSNLRRSLLRFSTRPNEWGTQWDCYNSCRRNLWFSYSMLFCFFCFLLVLLSLLHFDFKMILKDWHVFGNGLLSLLAVCSLGCPLLMVDFIVSECLFNNVFISLSSDLLTIGQISEKWRELCSILAIRTALQSCI